MTSTFWGFNEGWPSSRRDKSKTSSTTRRNICVARIAPCQIASCSALLGTASIKLNMPLMALMGVRISWLIFINKLRSRLRA